jgi:hypothetical protein
VSQTSQFFAIGCALVLLFLVVDRLRRRRLRERHALWWFVGAVVALLAGIFPSAVESVAAALGFVVPANLMFFVSVALLVFVAIQHASELTDLEAQTRMLAERVAILELELRRSRGGEAQASEGAGEDSA